MASGRVTRDIGYFRPYFSYIIFLHNLRKRFLMFRDVDCYGRVKEVNFAVEFTYRLVLPPSADILNVASMWHSHE